MVNAFLSSLKKWGPALLVLGLQLMAVGQPQAASDKYVLDKLGADLVTYGIPTNWIEVLPGAQGATGSFPGLQANTAILQTGEGALTGKAGPINFAGSMSFTPAIITGDFISQDFTSNSSFSMVANTFRPGVLLSGSIVGGTITGQLGSSADIHISLTVRNLASDVVALATEDTILTLSVSAQSPLSSICFVAQGQCASQDAYLASFSLLGGRWSIPGSALASAVPEPQTSLMLVLGLAFMGIGLARHGRE